MQMQRVQREASSGPTTRQLLKGLAALVASAVVGVVSTAVLSFGILMTFVLFFTSGSGAWGRVAMFAPLLLAPYGALSGPVGLVVGWLIGRRRGRPVGWALTGVAVAVVLTALVGSLWPVGGV